MNKLKLPIIISLCIILIVFLFYNPLRYDDENKIPLPTESTEQESVSEIYFTNNDTIFLSLVDTANINLELHNVDMASNEFEIINDNPEAVCVEYSKNNDENILYTVSALSPGISNIYITSSNGLFASDKIQVIVESPEDIKSNSDGRYILNTNTKKIHYFGCAYAPLPSAAGYKITNTLDGTSDYTWCEKCK